MIQPPTIDPHGAVNYGVLVKARHLDGSPQLLLVFGCRNCGKSHTHGWSNPPTATPQWRTSHCNAKGAQDYRIAPMRNGRRFYVTTGAGDLE